MRVVLDHKDLLARVLDLAPDGIAIAVGGRVVFANATLAALLEWGQAEALVGVELLALFHPGERRPAAARIEQLLRTGTPAARREERFLTRSGRELVLETHALLLPLGSREAVLFFARDLTERKQAERELSRLREEFAAAIVHDLRNPVQAILLQARLLLQSAGDSISVPRSAIQRIEQSGQRLAQMAGDLLDATRIELQRLQIDLRPVDILMAVSALIERIRPTLGPHPIELGASGDLPPAPVDPVRFDQILTNLLDNASKYSASEAPIRVHLGQREGGVFVSVQDHGCGIAESELPRLFDRFYQSGQPRQRRSGLGLGLYIAKGLVEAHGGRIWVESQLGQGSTFVVWLPGSGRPTSSPASESP